MKTIADSDWLLISDAVRKVIDTTLSRSEQKMLADAMARVETEPELIPIIGPEERTVGFGSGSHYYWVNSTR